MATAKEIALFLDQELDIHAIDDKSNNGLQVENSGEIKKIGFAVDASLETFQQALAAGCNMIIVHHGLFWTFNRTYLTSGDYQKVKLLIENNIALYAAHMPLDAHIKYGNNIQIANLLGLEDIQPFGEYHGKYIGYKGKSNLTLDQVKSILSKNKMQTLTLPFGSNKIKNIAILSGSGSREIVEAIKDKIDLYITGEAEHHLYHQAKEENINVIFAGHYETEVWGVKALMPLLKQKFKLSTEFIDVPTLI